MTYFDFAFEAPLSRHGVGRDRKIWYTVLFLPDDLASQLPFKQYPQLRVEGEVADVPVKNAFIPAGDGRYYVIVSPETLKQNGFVLGQTVEMRFRVADQNAVDIPEILIIALSGDGVAEKAWNALTVGRRRGLSHHVNSAKSEATRKRRVEAVVTAVTGRKPKPAVAADVARLSKLLGKP